jgi:hypothetical protein
MTLRAALCGPECYRDAPLETIVETDRGGLCVFAQGVLTSRSAPAWMGVHPLRAGV